jgi:hypothetical protein
MGYRGKIDEQFRARALRAEAWTLQDIAAELGVSKSSVSLWVRDVPFTPNPRRTAERRAIARGRGPNALQRRKQAEIDEMNAEGLARLGSMDRQAFLAAGAALYAGEGSKRDGSLCFANSDPRMIALHCARLRTFFEIDESRLRLRLYLHQGLDLDAAMQHWSRVTGIPLEQFGAPYRAVPDVGIRSNKHEFGCATVQYSCSRTHRAVMGLVRALLSSPSLPG